MSIQRGVAIILPEIWLRKTSPVVTFAKSNLPEKRYEISLSEYKIFNMVKDSTDFLKKNMFNCYLNRPHEKFNQGSINS